MARAAALRGGGEPRAAQSPAAFSKAGKARPSPGFQRLLLMWKILKGRWMERLMQILQGPPPREWREFGFCVRRRGWDTAFLRSCPQVLPPRGRPRPRSCRHPAAPPASDQLLSYVPSCPFSQGSCPKPPADAVSGASGSDLLCPVLSGSLDSVVSVLAFRPLLVPPIFGMCVFTPFIHTLGSI